mmetsp:Transcript_5293/g.8344  ORF Transcript_5293/g.8344 Transcript_5293/m.8344 type:complete len:92 (-) Transcript_5293:1486-1761(-)
MYNVFTTELEMVARVREKLGIYRNSERDLLPRCVASCSSLGPNVWSDGEGYRKGKSRGVQKQRRSSREITATHGFGRAEKVETTGEENRRF